MTPQNAFLNDIPDELLADIINAQLAYQKEYANATIIVKASGKIVGNKGVLQNFTKQISALRRGLGVNIVVVHGAGKQIDSALSDAGFTSAKDPKTGLRISERDHLPIIDRIARNTNTVLCDAFNQFAGDDIYPIGISGYESEVRMQSHPINANKNNYSGLQVTKLETGRLRHLMENKKAIPIITNMCRDQNGTLINVNADSVASALAIALKARRLLLCSDGTGVQDENGTVIKELSYSRFVQLRKTGVISGGMIPKVKEAFETARNMPENGGVVIMDENFLIELMTHRGRGTLITPPKKRR